MSVPLVKEFYYDVPMEEVWRALTTKEEMKRWYFPQLQNFEPVVGFEFQFQKDGAEYQKEWKVTKVITGKTFAHTWAYKGYPGTSEVQFDLFPEEDRTRLKVTQTGLEHFPNHPHFKRERFERGWDQLLERNLRRLLEERPLL
jgi:uncharacterized protein YndB with AHSA1/START domain